MITSRLTLTIALAISACELKPHPAAGTTDRIDAASGFTQRYSHSRLAAWQIHAGAAGESCDVLLIETSIVMEESMVEALHYGAGAYGVYGGGVQRFCQDRSFRGVAYRDASGRIWAYGNVTAREAMHLRRCG